MNNQNKSEGELDINRVIKRIAYKHGTPFFLFQERKIARNYNSIVNAFSFVKPRIFYSVKTNYELAVMRAISRFGCGAAVSGALDLYAALRSGFEPHKIIIDGLFKTESFLKEVITIGVDTINVESLKELKIINKLGAKANKVIDVGIRCRLPMFSADMRNVLILLRLRPFDKFGVSADDIFNNIGMIKSLSNVNVNSLMVHNVLPFMHANDFISILRYLFPMARKLIDLGVNVQKINIGGGLTAFNRGIEIERTIARIEDVYRKMAEKHNINPLLILEPGKALTENSGVLAGKIVEERDNWLIVDFSASDYGFTFPFKSNNITLIPKDTSVSSEAEKKKYRIKSSNLSQYDVLKEVVCINRCRAGDLIIMHNVGAYSLPFSYQFIKPRSPVYFMKAGGKIILARREETCGDVVTTQVQNEEIILRNIY